MICQAMVGTPPIWVSFSSWISCMAFSGSHLRIMASLAPPNSEGFITAKQPVAWKNGTEISEPFCGRLGSGWGGASPRRRKLRAPAAAAAKMLLLTLRCVPRAPLGLPVVPEV
jgi:hypothetical protein